MAAFYRKHHAYSNLQENHPFIVSSRQETVNNIICALTNNCKLLSYYGLTVKQQIAIYYSGTGLKLNQMTMSSLKVGRHKDCSFRLFGYIAQFWGLPLPLLFDKEFSVEQAKDIVVFPSFVVLPVKKVKKIKVKTNVD